MSATRGQLLTLERIAIRDGWTVSKGTASTVTWTTPGGRRVLTGQHAEGTDFAQARHQLELAGLIIPGRRPRDMSQVIDLTPKTEKEAEVAKQAPRPAPALNKVSLNWNDEMPGLDPDAHQAAGEVAEIVRENAFVSRLLDKLTTIVRQVTAEMLETDVKPVQGGVLALEAMVNELADQFKLFRDHEQDVLPGLRRDVRDLKERPLVDAKAITDAIGPYVAGELLKQRVAFDRDLAALKNELEGELLSELSDLETRLVEKIQNAAAAVDPLTALKNRLAGK